MLSALSQVPLACLPEQEVRAEQRAVCQGYAELLVGCLGRTSHSRFDLTGLQVYSDVQALVGSLERCLSWHDDPLLRQWQMVLQDILERYAAAREEVAQAQTWLLAIREVLDTTPLPTATAPGAGGDAVALELAHVLGSLAENCELSPWLCGVREHLWGVSERYWRGLFVCYDLVGVPRTNNELEGLFGATRRRIRQQSGAKQVRRAIGRQGAWLIYRCDADVEVLQQRLAGVPHALYHQERAHFEQRQARFRQRLHWRRNRAGVLDQLETQWASVCANSTL